MVFKQQMGQLLEREVGKKRLPLSSRKKKILAKDFPSPVAVSNFPCKREKEIFGCVGLSTVYFAMQCLCFAAVAQRRGIDTSSSHYVFLNHCHVALRAGQTLNVGMAIFTFFLPLQHRTFVNGTAVVGPTQLHHGDRILWGNNHFFR